MCPRRCGRTDLLNPGRDVTHLKGRARTALMSVIYLLGLVLFGAGSVVIFTLPKPTG
jgi:hypothetical protein